MAIYVSLVRGINVGGRQRLTMDRLRDVYVSLGLSGVASYLQSGNVVFDAPARTGRGIPRRVETLLEERTGLRVSVVQRDLSAWREIVAGNPLVNARGIDTNRLHVTFLDGRPTARALARLDDERGTPDRFVVHGTEIYLHCPGGYGKTKLSNDYFERTLGLACTTRNWKTVNALLELGSRALRTRS